MGTIYLRARHYNPSNGRFTQRDSYVGKQGDPLSLNLYTYCHNNPIRYIDPTGHNLFKKWHNFWEGFGSYQYDISQGKEDNIFDTYYKTGGDLYEAKESVVQTTKNIAKANAVINKGIINKVQAYESQKTK